MQRRIPIPVKAVVNNVVIDNILEEKLEASSLLYIFSLKRGMNDAVRAPSPKILLARLGNVRAVMKADIEPPVPKK